MGKVLIIQHLPNEGAGTIEWFLQQNSFPFLVHNVYETKDELGHPELFSHLVVMGGFMGVYEADQYPFLTKEMKFMEEFAKIGGKILGVCLGAQMLAHVFGARVYKGDKGKEVGWYIIHPTEAGLKDPLFGKLFEGEEDLYAFQWHGDTFDLPEGATLLASTDTYPNQAFCVDSKLYGLQFHIEVSQEMVKEWFPENPEWHTPPFGWEKLLKRAFSFYKTFFLT
ncbi:MAG: type 1 glutamine amidotransferase [Syntrophobacterales bacterium]|nr:type 1 glutamine amidotransferase [Syntrophobacterales bacterium]